jgi:hypothetical protein
MALEICLSFFPIMTLYLTQTVCHVNKAKFSIGKI